MSEEDKRWWYRVYKNDFSCGIHLSYIVGWILIRNDIQSMTTPCVSEKGFFWGPHRHDWMPGSSGGLKWQVQSIVPT